MVNEVLVNVGRRESVNVQLETGDISATVVVQDTSTPLLQTESASIGTVVTTKQLTDLPSQDRNIYGFLNLDSTVTSGFGGNAEAFRLESGGTFVVSGTRASSITFKIDGRPIPTLRSHAHHYSDDGFGEGVSVTEQRLLRRV
jgi:hypothetical protein